MHQYEREVRELPPTRLGVSPTQFDADFIAGKLLAIWTIRHEVSIERELCGTVGVRFNVGGDSRCGFIGDREFNQRHS